MIEISIENEEICISLGLDGLVFATENHPNLQDEECESRYKVADKREWMKSVVIALKDEREDGSTLATDMFDKAIFEAVEQGYEGIEELEGWKG